MRLELDETHLRIRLTRGEKILAVHGDITIPLAEITSVSVDPDPMQSIRGHLLVGLRVPRRRYLCTSGLGREFWAVRGRRPALQVSFTGRRLRMATISIPDPEGIAERIHLRRRALS